jgi:hypothetical protein
VTWHRLPGRVIAPLCHGSGFEGIVGTIIPHSSFGDPDCCGCLNGIIHGGQADIVCNVRPSFEPFMLPIYSGRSTKWSSRSTFAARSARIAEPRTCFQDSRTSWHLPVKSVARSMNFLMPPNPPDEILFGFYEEKICRRKKTKPRIFRGAQCFLSLQQFLNLCGGKHVGLLPIRR